MACKGICTRYKAQKPSWEWGRYASGQRRCQICELFIEWDGLWCPCCGYRLRSKPRNSKYKAKLRQDTYEIHSNKHEPQSSQTIFYEFPGADSTMAEMQESGRDQGHCTLSLALLTTICQLAWNQGDDLWGFRNNIVLKASEYVAKYNIARLNVP